MYMLLDQWRSTSECLLRVWSGRWPWKSVTFEWALRHAPLHGNQVFSRQDRDVHVQVLVAS